jgi:hypothetical protein
MITPVSPRWAGGLAVTYLVLAALLVAAGLATIATGAEPAKPPVPDLSSFREVIPPVSAAGVRPQCNIHVEPLIEPYHPIVATLELPPIPEGKPAPGVLIFWDSIPVPGSNTTSELEWREFDSCRTLCGWARPGKYRIKVKCVLFWWEDKTFVQLACQTDVSIKSPDPPPVGTLTVDPPQIAKGQSATLNWSATGATTARDQEGLGHQRPVR